MSQNYRRIWMRPLRAIVNDRSGAILIMMALLLPAFIVIAAMSVEAGRDYMMRAQLQASADAAALAGASQLNTSTSAVKSEATKFAALNMPTSAWYDSVVKAGDVVLGLWDSTAKTFTSPASDTNAVKVTARLSSTNSNAVKLIFGKVAKTSTSNVTASAIALGISTGTGCALALDPSASGAVSLVLGGQLDLDGCGVYSNSTSSSAISCDFFSSIVGPATAVGGVSAFFSNCGSPRKTGSVASSDPYSNVSGTKPTPCTAQTAPVRNAFSLQTNPIPLSPGCYAAGIDVENGSTLNLSPGVYYIESKFILAGTAGRATTLNGTGGVTIVLDGSFPIFGGLGSFSGLNVDINITAPTSGPTSGIALMSTQGSSSTVEEFFGGVTLTIQGAIYFPKQAFQLDAFSSVVSSSCTQVIADKIAVRVVSSLKSDCNGTGTKPIGGSTKLRLVQ
jgi:Flp pilus assembly protein TadG